jgi:anti-anti-sigma regulatory factor
MNISVNQTQGRVPVAVLGVQGDLDASNFELLIAQVQDIYRAGTRHVLLDLSQTTFVSSSGLVALHSIALLLKGEQPPSRDEGWSAIRAVGRGLGPGPQPYVKLLNPQPKVERVLDKAGLKEFFEIHTDLATAISSF